jgi:hypothetical protein
MSEAVGCGENAVFLWLKALGFREISEGDGTHVEELKTQL